MKTTTLTRFRLLGIPIPFVVYLLIYILIFPHTIGAEQSIIISPVEDAHVKQDYSHKNYAKTTDLISSNYYSENKKVSYLKFDLDKIRGKRVVSATLILTPNLSRNIEKQVRLVRDGWKENSLTWSNKPNTNEILGTLPLQKVEVNKKIKVSLNPSLIQHHTGAIISIAVVNTDFNSTLSIYSSESSIGQPQLEIEFEDWPQLKAGDANNDGVADEKDHSVWLSNIGKYTNNGHIDGDFSLNGKVDGGDFNVWLLNSVIDNNISPTAIPTTTVNNVTETPFPATPPIETNAEQLKSVAEGDFGIYPDCIPPAIPAESQAWWLEKTDPLPTDGVSPAEQRHVHIGACMPNSRTVNGKEVAVNGTYDVNLVIVLHNNPGDINWVNMGIFNNTSDTVYVRRDSGNCPGGICGDGDWTTQMGNCVGGGSSCVTFSNPLDCPTGRTCSWIVPMKVQISPDGCSGLCEMRIRPMLSNIPPRGDRQFTTNNFQIHLGGSGNYRQTPDPMGRAWYTGLEYAVANIRGYMDLFNGRTDISIPEVSGTINLTVAHREAGGSDPRRILTIDPNFHHNNPGTVIYDEAGGNIDKEISIDTTKLSNGVHTLFASTSESNEMGTNTGIFKVFINVKN